MNGVDYIIYDNLKNTDYLMENAFWIGCHDALTENDLDYEIETIRKFIDGK